MRNVTPVPGFIRGLPPGLISSVRTSSRSSKPLTPARPVTGFEMGEWATASRADLSVGFPSSNQLLQPDPIHPMADASSSADHVQERFPSQGLVLGPDYGVSQVPANISWDPKLDSLRTSLLDTHGGMVPPLSTWGDSIRLGFGEYVHDSQRFKNHGTCRHPEPR